MISESNVDERTKFKSSVQIIVYFLSHKMKDGQLLMSLTQQINFCGYADVMDSHNIIRICDHLVEVCSSNDSDVRLAFRNITLFTYEVKRLEQLRFVRYAAKIERIMLCDMDQDWKSIQLKLNEDAVGKCKKLYIEDCQFQDEEIIQAGKQTADENFQVLAIARCEMNMASFLNICQFGMSCGMLSISNLEIESSWWKELVNIIKEKLSSDELKLATMILTECATNLNEELKLEASIMTN